MHKMVQTKADFFSTRSWSSVRRTKCSGFSTDWCLPFCSMYLLCNGSVSSSPLLCSLLRLEKWRSEIWQNSPLIRSQVGVAGVEGEGWIPRRRVGTGTQPQVPGCVSRLMCLLLKCNTAALLSEWRRILCHLCKRRCKKVEKGDVVKLNQVIVWQYQHKLCGQLADFNLQMLGWMPSQSYYDHITPYVLCGGKN